MLKQLLSVAALAASIVIVPTGAGHAATKITIATVNNADMLRMRDLSKNFIRENPDIQLDWVVVEETVMRVMRDRFINDIEKGKSDFDVMTIGTYETPIWASNGWLAPLNFKSGYDVDDLIKPIRDGLSVDGKLYAAPFYGESSMTMYRKDLFRKAGLTMPDEPTWTQIRAFAKKVNDPAHGVYGICLRGKAGWGENMALVTTMANSYGARWFDMAWKPQFDTDPWKKSIEMYVDLLGRFGPPDPGTKGFIGNLKLFRSGKCAIWVDATVAAGYVKDAKSSTVANHVGFAQAPYEVTRKGSHWLWSWALAIPASSHKKEAATRFIAWATSKSYTRLVAQRDGWASVPPGTRTSLYRNPAYLRAAPFAKRVLSSILTADPIDNTLKQSPYVGVQVVAIPEFQRIGTIVGQQFSAAVEGNLSVSQALENAQRSTTRIMKQAGYYNGQKTAQR